MLITDKDLCTGCGVCSNMCHVKATKMVSPDKGFMYSGVDDTLCVNCKQCIKKCHINNQSTA